jgi:DNA-binding MarR family transcriptional regulator
VDNGDGAMPVRWLDPAESSAWRAWVAMSELVKAHIARDLQQASGMSEADYSVLVCLSEAAEHMIRMSDLARLLGWSKSRVSHQVARMEGRGQVTRRDCPLDARGWFAVLTDSGLDDIRQAAPLHVESVRRHLIDALDTTQLGQLEAIATTVLDHLVDTSDVDAAYGLHARTDGTDLEDTRASMSAPAVATIPMAPPSTHTPAHPCEAYTEAPSAEPMAPPAK